MSTWKKQIIRFGIVTVLVIIGAALLFWSGANKDYYFYGFVWWLVTSSFVLFLIFVKFFSLFNVMIKRKSIAHLYLYNYLDNVERCILYGAMLFFLCLGTALVSLIALAFPDWLWVFIYIEEIVLTLQAVFMLWSGIRLDNIWSRHHCAERIKLTAKDVLKGDD